MHWYILESRSSTLMNKSPERNKYECVDAPIDWDIIHQMFVL